MWVSGTSQFYSIEDVENSAKQSNTDSTEPVDSANKSVSKMRSYLRRCESAINSINLSAKRSLSLSSPSTPTTSNDAAAGGSKSTNSSWYVDEIDPETAESANEMSCANGKLGERTHQMEPSILNSDEQTISVQCSDESANDCAPKLPQQQQILISPVSKNRIIFFSGLGNEQEIFKFAMREKVRNVNGSAEMKKIR